LYKSSQQTILFHESATGKIRVREKIKNIFSGSYQQLKELSEHFQLWLKTQPHRAHENYQSEEVSGNHLSHSSRVKNCFYSSNLENCAYITEVNGAHHCQDVDYFCLEGLESVYNSHVIGFGANNILCSHSIVRGCRDIAYSQFCWNNSHDLLGCVSLNQSQYCIFNKQYTKEEYFELKDKIIAHMRETKEWGEFFPAPMSPFAYNETVAQEYFPLTQEAAEARGYTWRTEDRKSYQKKTFSIPDNIADVKDDILKEVLTCEKTGKNYKIQKSELKFYQKMNLPIPRLCADERHKKRMALRNPRKLYERSCGECETGIKTTYSSERPEKILCEDCYLKSVN